MFMLIDQPLVKDLQVIDENSWLFGDCVIERKELAKNGVSPLEDGVSPLFKDDKYYYTISEAKDPRPATTDLPKDGPARMIWYSFEDSCCSWTLGGVILRVKYREPSEWGTATEEVDTLKWIQERNFSFATPRMLHFHTRFDRSFTIRTMLPGQLTGQRVADKWLGLSPEEKTKVSEQVVQLFLEMAQHTSSTPSGVDGKWLCTSGLAAPPPYKCYDPRCVKAVCKELGYDCDEFVLAPAKCYPGLFVIMPDRSLGVTEFDHIGYVPKGWVVARMVLECVNSLHLVEERLKEWGSTVCQFGPARALRWVQEDHGKKNYNHITRIRVSQYEIFHHFIDRLDVEWNGDIEGFCKFQHKYEKKSKAQFLPTEECPTMDQAYKYPSYFPEIFPTIDVYLPVLNEKDLSHLPIVG